MGKAKYYFLFSYLFITHQGFTQYCIEGRFDTQIFDSLDIISLTDIEYATAINYFGSEQSLKLDLYFPDTILDPLNKKPCVIFVHGGGLVGGSKSTDGAITLAQDFARKGFAVACINYRMGWETGTNCDGDTTSLEYALYRGVQDVKASLRFLKYRAEEFQLDTNFFFLSGNSVGSTLCLYSAYAKQTDFPAYLSESLGSLDSSGNGYDNFSHQVGGIIARAGGIQYPFILNNTSVPVEFFHGTCDKVVPFTEGPLYSCVSPQPYPFFFGPVELTEIMKEKNIPYEIYVNEGYDHEAVENDTALVYGSRFIKNILCNSLPEETEYFRTNNTGCAQYEEEDITFNIFPNPFSDLFSLEIFSGIEQDIHISLYSMNGQKLFDDIIPFSPPYGKFEFAFSDAGLQNGIYLLKIERENYISNFLIEKMH